MKTRTARKILCNSDFAEQVAKTQQVAIQKVVNGAKNLLNKVNKREKRRKKNKGRE